MNRCGCILALALSALLTGCANSHTERTNSILSVKEVVGVVVNKHHTNKTHLNPMKDLNPWKSIDPRDDIAIGTFPAKNLVTIEFYKESITLDDRELYDQAQIGDKVRLRIITECEVTDKGGKGPCNSRVTWR